MTTAVEQINANTALIHEAIELARENRRTQAATGQLAVDLVTIALSDDPQPERAARVEAVIAAYVDATGPDAA